MKTNRILVVDDQEENLYYLRALLQGHGFEVVSALHGAEALDKARQNPPDLIISDILMPVMDGFALCRAWKKDARLKTIPFIFYTATYTEERDREFALSLGAERFVVKPEEPDALLEMIRETVGLGKRPPADPVPEPENEETDYLKQYSAALIRKLESKTEQLERANRVLERDMAERKQAEAERERLRAQLTQAQKLESIGTLASGVAHEINNPILAILGYAQFIADQKDASLELREYAAEIVKATDRVTAIVRNLLAFARQDQQERVSTNVADIVISTLSLIQAVLRNDAIDLEVDIPAELPPLICQSQRIQQVLMNLVTNARDSLNDRYAGSHADKKILIAARLLERERDAGPGGATRWIRLTVEDHGAGIPPEVRDRIFAPFFTTKPAEKGTGLGLAISHGIVTDHHGTLTVESEPGQYTRFHVDLPADVNPETDHAV